MKKLQPMPDGAYPIEPPMPTVPGLVFGDDGKLQLAYLAVSSLDSPTWPRVKN